MFAVLGLTIFAVLAVATANTEEKLAEKYAAAVADYYAADLSCAETACRFGALWEAGAAPEAFAALADELDAAYTVEGDAAYVRYARPIDETQRLCVTLRLDGGFTAERWQVENTGDWAPDDSLNVWDGK